MSVSGVEAERLADLIEARACADLYAAAPAALQACSHAMAGATVLCLPTLPVSYFNRVVGLGNDQPATEADLDLVIGGELEEHHRADLHVSDLDECQRPALSPKEV